MVGKIKHVRQKLHQEAVKLDGRTLPPLKAVGYKCRQYVFFPSCVSCVYRPQVHNSFPTGIFAGTKITPEALVQTLKLEQPPDVPVPPEEKKVKSKKEKMKERRERWLNKISFIKQFQEQQAATARRQATPVVGDLRPLADALPELCQLRPLPTPTLLPVKRTEPTDFSQMKQSQKRKLLETETSRFSDAIKSLATKTNPLADIGEQLRKRMRQEEEQGPS
uniref:Family with sequence similarity 207 member A n=1 Tax=Sphaeramia orbicularis TaxID=375764 RepID=A0A673A6Z1_9TELE